MIRRLLALAAVVVFIVAAVVIGRHEPTVVAAVYGTNDQPPMPVAPTGDALTTTWFCPGVPAAGDGSTGTGTVSVLNPSDTPMNGSVTYYPAGAASVTKPLQVPARTQSDLVPKDIAPGPFAGVLVEVYGTNAIVSETTVTKQGSVSSACSTTASSTWYLADGNTTVGATYDLLVLNPFPDDAIVDVSFAADDGPRRPSDLQGFVVPAKSLRIVSVSDVVQRDQLVSASVVARNGRVVVGRFQTLPDAPRKGLVAGLGTPSPGSQWYFANGQKGDGVAERVLLYNPGSNDATADVTIFPADATAGSPVPLSVTVPAGQRVDVNIATTDQVPAGPHTITVRSTDAPIVAERVLDVISKARTATTDQLGSRLAAARWYVPSGAPAGATSVLSILNTTGVDTTVSVDSLGPAGDTPVSGLQNVAVGAGSGVQVNLNDHAVANQPIVIEADGPVVVEQFVTPAANRPGASSVLGVPVAGT